ncbi:MAG: protein phosphatase 2C domain-containing protein [bacterium]|nr:protein phosphatase 2C domain-containing protein [bacterium]
MNTDIYFEKGTSHTICEDYAISGTVDEWYFVIGSDGCSSSAGVDLGNRLLCHSARTAITDLVSLYGINDSIELENIETILRTLILERCNKLKKELKVPVDIFDATLTILLSNGTRNIILMYGDGAVIIKYNNRMAVINIEYESGAPYYLSYLMDEKKGERYAQKFGDAPVFINEYYKDAAGWNPEPFKYMNDEKYFIKEITAGEADPILMLTACSDGINTYFDANNDPVQIPGMADRFLDYKNVKGDFVKRRMNKITKENNRNGIIHHDDIFCGTIFMQKQESVLVCPPTP